MDKIFEETEKLVNLGVKSGENIQQMEDAVGKKAEELDNLHKQLQELQDQSRTFEEQIVVNTEIKNIFNDHQEIKKNTHEIYESCQEVNDLQSTNENLEGQLQLLNEQFSSDYISLEEHYQKQLNELIKLEQMEIENIKKIKENQLDLQYKEKQELISLKEQLASKTVLQETLKNENERIQNTIANYQKSISDDGEQILLLEESNKKILQEIQDEDISSEKYCIEIQASLQEIQDRIHKMETEVLVNENTLQKNQSYKETLGKDIEKLHEKNSEIREKIKAVEQQTTECDYTFSKTTESLQNEIDSIIRDTENIEARLNKTKEDFSRMTEEAIHLTSSISHEEKEVSLQQEQTADLMKINADNINELEIMKQESVALTDKISMYETDILRSKSELLEIETNYNKNKSQQQDELEQMEQKMQDSKNSIDAEIAASENDVKQSDIEYKEMQEETTKLEEEIKAKQDLLLERRNLCETLKNELTSLNVSYENQNTEIKILQERKSREIKKHKTNVLPLPLKLKTAEIKKKKTDVPATHVSLPPKPKTPETKKHKTDVPMTSQPSLPKPKTLKRKHTPQPPPRAVRSMDYDSFSDTSTEGAPKMTYKEFMMKKNMKKIG